MEIKITIPKPPKGFGVPKRGPLYTYHQTDDIMVLTGQCWSSAKDMIQHGGAWWIYSVRRVKKED